MYDFDILIMYMHLLYYYKLFIYKYIRLSLVYQNPNTLVMLINHSTNTDIKML